MELPDDVEFDSPRDHDEEFRHPESAYDDATQSGDVIIRDDVKQTKEVDLGQRDYSEGALCQVAEKVGLTLKGQINVGGQMDITHHNFQDNRTITKHVHHHEGDLHQHTHNQYVKEGDVIHHHGDLYQTHYVHYSDNETGYVQIRDQSELAMRSDEKVFVETWAFRAALGQVSRAGFLVLTGPTGSGKTCIGHALLRHYKSLAYTPLVLHRFEEWRTHVGGDRQQVILLEDVFGKDHFHNASFSEWVHTFPTIQQLAENGKCVIIITINDVILGTIHEEHGSCSFLSHTLNLNSSDACLSEDERRSILEAHLKYAETSVSAELFEEILTWGSNMVLFPAQCKQFAQSSPDESEPLKVFTATNEVAMATCGTGPKAFFKISPEIIKKSLLKPTPKMGRWGYCFTNTKGDISKRFGDDDWTTESIQQITNRSGIDYQNRSSSENKECTAPALHKSEQAVPTDGGVAVSRFEAACMKGDAHLVREMIVSDTDFSLTKKTGFTALHVASLAGYVDIVETLLNHKCSLDVADKENWTPLHVTCYTGHTEVAELLVKHGADLEMATFCGMRALHIACRYGHTEIVQLLLQNGATTEARPITGYMAYPLHVAAFYGHVNIIELLIKFQAKTNVTDRGGWLPLHYACQEGHLDVVDILLSASMATPNRAGQSLQLKVDCHNGHSHLVKSLLQCGISSYDPDGKTAVCRSCYLSNKHPLENLLRHHTYPDNPGNGNTTALFLATQNGHYEIVSVLLKAGACTEVRMSGGWTPLLVASYKGHQNIVELLLRYKTDVNDSLDNVLLTALHLASANGHRETVDVLLRHGAVPDLRDNYQCSPLHRACLNGHHNVLPSLLAKVKESYSDKKSAETLLSFAVKSGSVDTISCLHEWFPDIFDIAQDSSALHDACRNGNLDMVKKLLEHQFPVNARGDVSGYKGETPIHVASINGNPVVVDVLIDHGAKVDEKTSHGNTALHLACRENNIDVVKILLEAGAADKEIRNEEDQTPLHVAADRGLNNIVALLVACNAKVNVRDLYGQTPLICGSRYSLVVDIFLKNNADANIPTFQGETVLHKICAVGKEDILRSLLLHKIFLEAKDKNGETALFLACRAKNSNNMVKMLLENEADVEAIDDLGMTPVQLACDLGNVDLLGILLQHGGRVDSRNKNGETPLHKACIKGHSHLIKVLHQAGARVNEADRDGNTSLHAACLNLQPHCVRVLLELGTDVKIKNKEGLYAVNTLQSVQLSQGQRSEEEKSRRRDKRTDIMVAFMEFSQQFALKKFLTAAQDTGNECREPLHQTDSAADSIMCQVGHAADNMGFTAVDQMIKETGMEMGDRTKILAEKAETGVKKGDSKDEDVIELDVAKRGDERYSAEGTVPSSNQSDDLEKDRAAAVLNTPTQERDRKKRMTEDLELNKTASTVHADHPLTVQQRNILDNQNGSIDENRKKSEAILQTVEREMSITSVQWDPVLKEDGTIDKSSPLHRACFDGHTDLVLHHLFTSSNVDGCNESGQTSLHYACSAGQHDIAALLLQHGANPMTSDASGYTPLHVASLHGHLHTVDLLLTQGLDIDVTDKDGKTALHLASSRGHGLVAALLISHGASVNAVDFLGSTPLMLACAGSHSEASVILLNFGADMESRNNQGQTVYDFVKSGNLQVLEKLIARHSMRKVRPPTEKRAYQERWLHMALFFSFVLVCVVAVWLSLL